MSSQASQPVALRELLEGLAPAPHISVKDVTLDSRSVSPGSLFIAYPGASIDGRDFIDEAVAGGAAAVVFEPDGYESGDPGVPLVPVAGLRRKAGIIADRFFNAPSHSIKVIGITGTNGKTTCCYLLAQALNIAGNSAGIIGTLGIGTFSDRNPALNTTPDPVTLHREMAAMVEQGLDYVCIEVSSHALDQGRVSGVTFYATMFTNLSRDHLDYHDDMQAYADTKERLFTEFDGPVGVVNIDDPTGRLILSRSERARNWSFGDGGDISALEVHLNTGGISVLVQERAGSYRIDSPLIGRVNVDNLLAVITMLRALGMAGKQIPAIVAQLQPAPGRMELIHVAEEERPWVVIDYAHTPDALEQALLSLREYCTGVLWCIFGCGGDRDQGKRPAMGAVAEKFSDRVVVTDDNPRSESPGRIIDAILSGMQRRADVIHERATAIQWVISQAGGDDWVLIAGKGHETQQVIGNESFEFSDRHWVQECLGVAA